MSTKPSIEQLLKPRYKVIADYPSNDFEIGQILIESNTVEDWLQTDNWLHGIKLSAAKAYPHLFKQLSWWEEREVGELIGLIVKKISYPFTITKVNAPISIDGRFFVWDNMKNSAPFEDYLPATEAEYLTYINKEI